MRKELTIAIISTVGYVLMYIIFAVTFLRGYILSNPFWFSGVTTNFKALKLPQVQKVILGFWGKPQF